MLDSHVCVMVGCRWALLMIMAVLLPISSIMQTEGERVHVRVGFVDVCSCVLVLLVVGRALYVSAEGCRFASRLSLT